jgi:hypothetical protein
LLRAALRMPIHLYRFKLGWLFGRRFLGYSVDGSEGDYRQFARQLPFARFVRRPAD